MPMMRRTLLCCALSAIMYSRVQVREEDAMPRIGPMELIIVLAIVLIIFGAGRLPEIGGALGKGIRAFKRGQSGDEEPGADTKAKENTKDTEKTKT